MSITDTGEECYIGRTLPDYEDVVTVSRLPRQTTSDGLFIRHGYAAEIGPDLWFFFDSVLPALAFGRAARMSYQCALYGVVRAAHEVRYRPGHSDVRTLYVIHRRLDRVPGEKEQLKRWVNGIDPTSAHWRGPDR
jgi:hypothetical protein